MSYQATVVPVMIASPGDVNTERDAIRSVIHDWNDINASHSKLILIPVSWETNATPELGVRAQEHINTTLLIDCDLLIGVFWTRLGTPTGKAASGTVEEIQKHIAAGKPAMIYFSSVPVALKTVDLSQYEELKKFEAWCKGQGLIETYDSVDQFKEKLYKQLSIKVFQSTYIAELFTKIEPSLEVKIQNQANSQVHVSISAEATDLLLAAASDKNGIILSLRFLGGRVIQTGGSSFGGDTGRENAKWENALNELVINDLVTPRGYKGEMFEMTHLGWQVADHLRDKP